MRSAAEQISSVLHLDIPPVALAFVEQQPAGVPADVDAAPSSCAFWRRAEHGVFYAAAQRHYNCAVGAMVMGFDLPPDVQKGLGEVVGSMGSVGYLDGAEAGQIPTVERHSTGIVYGPLADFPMKPDVALLWLDPAQAMLANEAVGSASWTEAPATITGRPTCAAIPLAVDGGGSVLSTGCIGMRTFTEIPDDRMLMAIPGDKVADLAEALQRAASANDSMQSFYEGHKRKVLGLV